MPRRTWTIPPNTDGWLHRAFTQLAGLIEEPIVSIPTWSAATEVANVRRVTGQVRDRLNSPADGAWLVLWWLTDDAGAPASPTGVTVNRGQDLGQAGSGSDLRLAQTDNSGVLALDIEVAGAATRRIRSVVLGPVVSSGAIAWT